MDIARLILEYLDVLAWPVVFATFFLTFRRSIAGLIDRARNASALGVTAEFAERIEEVIDEEPGLEDEERKSLKESVRATNVLFESQVGEWLTPLRPRTRTEQFSDLQRWATENHLNLRSRQQKTADDD